ncbi:MAG: hypothetical protein LBF97_05070, partial [Elusimicrobiota bacterium]|nr:hypothetical protein [Elusimicrobiota bacterium]
MFLNESILQEIYNGYGLPEVSNVIINERLKTALKMIREELKKQGIEEGTPKYFNAINNTRKEVLDYFRNLSKERVRKKQAK